MNLVTLAALVFPIQASQQITDSVNGSLEASQGELQGSMDRLSMFSFASGSQTHFTGMCKMSQEQYQNRSNPHSVCRPEVIRYWNDRKYNAEYSPDCKLFNGRLVCAVYKKCKSGLPQFRAREWTDYKFDCNKCKPTQKSVYPWTFAQPNMVDFTASCCRNAHYYKDHPEEIEKDLNGQKLRKVLIEGCDFNWQKTVTKVDEYCDEEKHQVACEIVGQCITGKTDYMMEVERCLQQDCRMCSWYSDTMRAQCCSLCLKKSCSGEYLLDEDAKKTDRFVCPGCEINHLYEKKFVGFMAEAYIEHQPVAVQILEPVLLIAVLIIVGYCCGAKRLFGCSWWVGSPKKRRTQRNSANTARGTTNAVQMTRTVNT